MISAAVPAGTRAAKAGATRQASAWVAASCGRYLRLSTNGQVAGARFRQRPDVPDQRIGIGTARRAAAPIFAARSATRTGAALSKKPGCSMQLPYES